MKAILFDEFGGPEVLHEGEAAMPTPGPGQVRVRVAVAGVNPIDVKIRAGGMEAIFPTTLPAIPGADFAGVVDAVGEGVSDVSTRAEVFGWAEGGSYAEYTLCSRFAVKPADLSWEQAAAIPVAAEAAQRGLDQLDVQKGETLLIHGAAGAVGSIAVQLAVAKGLKVIGTAGEANHDFVRSLGATPVTYGDGLVQRVQAVVPLGVDAVLDAAGKGALPASIELRGGTSRILTLADDAAASLGIPFSSTGPDGPSIQVLKDVGDASPRAI
jgi:NADPH:quinone reductase-like Zn-dependent oxidoreductase